MLNRKIMLVFPLLLVVLIWVVFYQAGVSDGFIQTDSGMQYKIVQRDATGIAVNQGQYLKLSVTQVYGDTVLRSPKTTGLEYQQIDSAMMSPDAWIIFKGACLYDSLVFRVPADSAFRRPWPPFIKDTTLWLETRVKVKGILANADSVRADYERGRTY